MNTKENCVGTYINCKRKVLTRNVDEIEAQKHSHQLYMKQNIPKQTHEPILYRYISIPVVDIRRTIQQRTKNSWKVHKTNWINPVRQPHKCSECINRSTEAFAVIVSETKHIKPDTRTDRRTNNEQKIPSKISTK